MRKIICYTCQYRLDIVVKYGGQPEVSHNYFIVPTCQGKENTEKYSCSQKENIAKDSMIFIIFHGKGML